MSAAPSSAAPYLPDVAAFESGEIDGARFDHAAHVHVAWCYLERYGLAEAIARFTAGLQALTRRLGAEARYHETVSWFFMVVLDDRRADSPGADWETFREQNPDLFVDARALLRRHYSDDCLASARARSRFVLPDRLEG